VRLAGPVFDYFRAQINRLHHVELDMDHGGVVDACWHRIVLYVDGSYHLCRHRPDG